ncbi:hypothetical protein ACFL3A_02905 [Pseudomonadota bacterium]
MKVIDFYKILGFTSLYLFTGAAAAADDRIAVMHDAVSHVSVGDQVGISATINDPHSDVETVRTYFKTSQDNRFYFVVMKKTSGNTYTGLLPAPLHGAESLEYRILAKSASDQIVKSPRYVVEVENKGVIARLD